MSNEVIFHVLAKRSNTKTLCGATRTRHDEAFSWNHAAVGHYVPCEECLRIKRESLKALKSKKGA